jgi:hypothetical protein
VNASLNCAFATWSPGLGDNTPMGWVTVLVYGLAALGSARAALSRTGAEDAVRRERLFWGLLALLLTALAINKQLDLQSLMTEIGRCHAHLNGWYEGRARVQYWFVICGGLAGLVGLAFLAWLLRGLWQKLWPALLGAAFVSFFVLVRAASFHHVDILIGAQILGVRVNWLLELPGPILVLLVGWQRSRAR